jgi:hypothetical protein
LRKSIAERLEEHTKKAKAKKISPKKTVDGLAAYKGWVMRCNAKKLWRKNVTRGVTKYCKNVYNTNPLKGCV